MLEEYTVTAIYRLQTGLYKSENGAFRNIKCSPSHWHVKNATHHRHLPEIVAARNTTFRRHGYVQVRVNCEIEIPAEKETIVFNPGQFIEHLAKKANVLVFGAYKSASVYGLLLLCQDLSYRSTILFFPQG